MQACFKSKPANKAQANIGKVSPSMAQSLPLGMALSLPQGKAPSSPQGSAHKAKLGTYPNQLRRLIAGAVLAFELYQLKLALKAPARSYARWRLCYVQE